MSNLRNKQDQGKYICRKGFHKREETMYFSDTQKQTIQDIQSGKVKTLEDYLCLHAGLKPLIGTRGTVVTQQEWRAYEEANKGKVVLITNHTHPDYGSSVVFVVDRPEAEEFELRLREFTGLIDWLEEQNLIKLYSSSNNGFFVVSDNWPIKELGDVGLCSKIVQDFGNVRIVALPSLHEFIEQEYVTDDAYNAERQHRNQIHQNKIQLWSIVIASAALIVSGIAAYFSATNREVQVSVLPNGTDTVGVYLLSNDSTEQGIAIDITNTKVK